jgi:DAK2 domain fusion protein YloV
MAHPELDVARFRAWLVRARDEISRSRERLNAENLYPVADSDTGSNLEATIRAAAEAVESEISEDLGAIADAAAEGALHGAQGNSGVLLSQIFRGFADGLRENLPKAFALAHERALKAVADPKEGTILSVARAARDAATSVGSWGNEIRRDGEIALAAWKAARASTLDSAINPPSEAARGVIDAGAHGIELIYRSLVAVLDGEIDNVDDIPLYTSSGSPSLDVSQKSDGAFEVMYELTNLSEEQVELLRTKLSGIGQSLLIVGGAKFWKVHVHTDFVEESVAFAKEIGKPENIRITALDLSGCKSERTLVTVANGPGFETLMRESGVNVIKAFESRRVTPEEWVLAAGESTEVILIPHDAHGHQSAQDAALILESAKKSVAVINSNSPLQALSAISTHSEDLESNFVEEVHTMEAAARATLSLTIALAPRQLESYGEVVNPGAVIALQERKIIAHGVDVVDVAHEAISKVVNSATQLITLVTGANATIAVAQALMERISIAHPTLEVAHYAGGQAWYPLLIGIE